MAETNDNHCIICLEQLFDPPTTDRTSIHSDHKGTYSEPSSPVSTTPTTDLPKQIDNTDDEEPSSKYLGKLDSCHHEYHYFCIKLWLQKQVSCPYCRAMPATLEVTTATPERAKIRLESVHPLTASVHVSQDSDPDTESIEVIQLHRDLWDQDNRAMIAPCNFCTNFGNEHLLMLCDMCDMPVHAQCAGLSRVPLDYSWLCHGCRHLERPALSDSEYYDQLWRPRRIAMANWLHMVIDPCKQSPSEIFSQLGDRPTRTRAMLVSLFGHVSNPYSIRLSLLNNQFVNNLSWIPGEFSDLPTTRFVRDRRAEIDIHSMISQLPDGWAHDCFPDGPPGIDELRIRRRLAIWLRTNPDISNMDADFVRQIVAQNSVRFNSSENFGVRPRPRRTLASEVAPVQSENPEADQAWDILSQVLTDNGVRPLPPSHRGALAGNSTSGRRLGRSAPSQLTAPTPQNQVTSAQLRRPMTRKRPAPTDDVQGFSNESPDSYPWALVDPARAYSFKKRRTGQSPSHISTGESSVASPIASPTLPTSQRESLISSLLREVETSRPGPTTRSTTTLGRSNSPTPSSHAENTAKADLSDSGHESPQASPSGSRASSPPFGGIRRAIPLTSMIGPRSSSPPQRSISPPLRRPAERLPNSERRPSERRVAERHSSSNQPRSLPSQSRQGSASPVRSQAAPAPQQGRTRIPAWMRNTTDG